MAIQTNAGWDGVAAASAAGALVLVELAFTGGTVRVTNWPVDVTVLGQTWTGVGAVAEIGEIKESEDGGGETIEVGLSQVNSANLALALGAVETYQGRQANIYVGLVDVATLQIAGTPLLRFSGFMDKVKIRRDDDNSGTILLSLVSLSQDVRSNPAGLRYSDAQHQAEFPGELGFAYISELIGKPVQWLSKKFQQA